MKRLLALAMILVASVVHAQTLRSPATARGFTIGAGDNDPSIFNSDSTYSALVATQYNSVEPGNVMKQYGMNPSNGTYDFSQPDLVMSFAQTNTQTVTATAPIWDGGGISYCGNCGTPSYITGGGFSSGALTTIEQNYVVAFMNHMHSTWPGRMKQIALVSETSHTCPNGSYNPGYGTGIYCSTLGPDTASGSYASHVSGLTYFPKYVTVAYTAARAADPTAQLCYDDWGWEGSGASGYQYWQVAYLKSQGLVDCVGLEGQWQYAAIPTNVPSVSSIASTISAYQSLGLTVYFSQVELGIASNGTNNNVPNNFTWTNSSDLTTQANLYSQLINACLANSACNAFYTWGPTDKWAFLDSPGFNVGVPLPYDANYNTKPAYTAIYNALAAGSGVSLSVNANGTGSGTVSGTNNCVTNLYTSGTLVGPCTATANPGSVFAGWASTGGVSCSGTGTCPASGNFSLTTPTTITATFNATSGTVTANSCSQADVQAAANSLSAGTSLMVIPPGTCVWTGGVTLTVPSGNLNLTVQGSTTVSCTGTAGASSWACTPTDGTTIIDSYPSSTALFSVNVNSNASALLRFTGFTIAGGNASGGTGSKYNGWIDLQFSSLTQITQLRVDHMHFNEETYSPATTGVAVRTFVQTTGVGDHNVLDLSTANNNYPFGFSIFGAYGDTVGNGDGTFNNPTPWGSLTAAFYVESNVMNGGVINDCGNAGSMVIRYNTMNDASVAIQTHGTKSPAGPGRGCRSIEMYNNYITGPTGGGQASAALGTKGIAALIYNNTVASGYYRLYQGGGDRQSGDEVETNTPNGWGYCGTTVNGNGVGSAWDGNTNAGTGYPCLDGLGRGQTPQSLNGAGFPGRLNLSTGNIAWPHQYHEPQYLWNNTPGSSGGALGYMLLGDQSQNNQDYYFDCSQQTGLNPGSSTIYPNGGLTCNGTFTGAYGTGVGTHAARPASCTPGPGGTYFTSPTGSYGVAYFATDDNGGQGELYVCSAANTWSGIYQPAVYPHPLVGGASTITSVSASCIPSTISTAQTSTCSATVSGTGSFNPAVTWSATNGAITSGGVYTPNPSGAPFTGVVTATAVQDGTKSGSANVTVNGALAAPTYAPVGGVYSVLPSVTISGPAGATLCWKIGSAPSATTAGACDAGSTTYAAPVLITASPTNLQAIATKAANLNSAVTSQTYTQSAPGPPVLSVGLLKATGKIRW